MPFASVAKTAEGVVVTGVDEGWTTIRVENDRAERRPRRIASSRVKRPDRPHPFAGREALQHPPRRLRPDAREGVGRRRLRDIVGQDRETLDAHPSVPSATLTPSSIARAIRAKPLPSFMLLVGLWTSETPFSAMIRKSSSVHHTQCAA